jgi:excisionase family DNA binding protein
VAVERSGSGSPRSARASLDRARLQSLLGVTDPRYLTVADAARVAGFSRRAIYRSIERGELSASLVCSRLRIHPDDFLLWMEGEPAAVRSVPAPVAVSVARQAAAAEGLRSMLARQDTAA